MGKVKYPLPNIEQDDLLWIAGLLEGEGCFHGGPDHAKMTTVRLSMADNDVVQKFAAVVGRPHRPVMGSYLRNRQLQWTVMVSGPPARKLMKMLFSHMGKRKRGQILSILLDWKQRPRRRKKMLPAEVREIRRLYATGKLKMADIGNMFELSSTSTREIIRRITYPEIE